MLRLFSYLIFFALASAQAHASGWRVDRATGDAQVSADGQSWSPLQTGIEVPNSVWVWTGHSGQVMLTRGRERILLKRDTIAAIATWQQNGLNTQVTQRQGSIVLDIETRPRLNTTVLTPHLAAVVKGTAFEVTVENGRSVVRVQRGRVRVTANGSDSATELGPGQVAWVNATTQSSIQNQSQSNQPSRERFRAPTVPEQIPRDRSRTVSEAIQQNNATSDNTIRTPDANRNAGRPSGNTTPTRNTGGNGDGNRGVGNGNGGGNGTGNEGHGNSGGNGNGNRGVGNGNGGGNGTGNEGNGRNKNDDG